MAESEINPEVIEAVAARERQLREAQEIESLESLLPKIPTEERDPKLLEERKLKMPEAVLVVSQGVELS